MTLYTQNQSKNKITNIPGATPFGSLTCINPDNSEIINLTSLEEMWYGHEETINHPAGSEYPLSVNVPFLKLMRERVADSVLNRTGINIKDFDGIIHANTFGGTA